MTHGPFSKERVLELARQVYRRGEAGFVILKNRCALLVIDMQEEFVKPGWTPYWVPEATSQVPRIQRLIGHCREVGVPVIYTVFSETHGFRDRPYSGKVMPNRFSHLDCDQSSFFREGKVWEPLAPAGDEIVIHKPSYGAFYDTPLQTILRNMEKDTVIICGTLTNFCCSTTARQAYERGFNVVFGADVTSTDDPDLQEPELMAMRKGFARVMTAREIIKQL